MSIQYLLLIPNLLSMFFRESRVFPGGRLTSGGSWPYAWRNVTSGSPIPGGNILLIISGIFTRVVVCTTTGLSVDVSTFLADAASMPFYYKNICEYEMTTLNVLKGYNWQLNRHFSCSLALCVSALPQCPQCVKLAIWLVYSS